MKHFMNLKQECFQKKLVRFHKKKHKINPWLTAGILKSINSKDKIYKTLMQSSKDSINYPDLLSNFKSTKISLGEVLCMRCRPAGVLNVDINNDFNQYMPGKTNCTSKFEPIIVDIVSRINGGLKIKTSTGVDSVPNKLVNFVKNVTSDPLSIIINQMLKLGIFPDCLKISKVVPLYK